MLSHVELVASSSGPLSYTLYSDVWTAASLQILEKPTLFCKWLRHLHQAWFRNCRWCIIRLSVSEFTLTYTFSSSSLGTWIFLFLILRISLNELEPRTGLWRLGNALPPLTPDPKVFFLLFLLSAHLFLFHSPFLLFILFFLYVINILFLSFLYYASLWPPLSISCSLFMSLFSYLSLCFHILSLSIHPSVYLITFLSFCLLPAILSHSFGCPSVELFCFILCLFPHWCRTGVDSYCGWRVKSPAQISLTGRASLSI